MWRCGARRATPITLGLLSLNRSDLTSGLENIVHNVCVQGVIPAMLTAREGHGCIEFEGMFLAIGGYAHFYSKGPIVDEPSESFTYHSSGEFYDGQFWAELDSLALPRAHFALQPLCGSLVAIGGISGMSEHLDSVERLWTVWNSWIPADYFRLPQPLAHAGSAAVSGLGKGDLQADWGVLTVHCTSPSLDCW